MTFLEKFDKAKLQKYLLIAIGVLTLAALTLLLVIIVMSINPSGLKESDMKFTDLKIEEKDLTTGTLVLADKEHPYDVNKDQLDLVGCQSFRNEQMKADGIEVTKENYSYIAYAGMMMSKDAMANAHRMITDAKAAVGGKALTVDGAYGEVKNGDKDLEEYNTALLIFLSDYDSEESKYVALSDAYSDWLDKNAVKYGFIESFDGGYRYVGAVHAEHMTREKLSLADYIAYLKKSTSKDKGLVIKASNGSEYYVYYVSAKAGDSIKIPDEKEGTYTISGTNEGGIIVTCELK